MPVIAAPFIGTLAEHVAELPEAQQQAFQRLYDVRVSYGQLRAPIGMQQWLQRQFGSVDAVATQRIVRVTNRVTLEDVLYNALRSRRPIQMNDGSELMQWLAQAGSDDPLADPEETTPEDPFGRVRGAHSITAANVAKLDAHSGVIVFDEYNPLVFDRSSVTDCFDVGWEWARQANQYDPAAVYYMLIWNCLWRAGASLLHGHAQTLLGRGQHYGKVEALRRTAGGYSAGPGRSYFDDLFAVHESLGLGFEVDGVRIMAHLTPLKEKETLVMAPPFHQNLPGAVYQVLACLRDRMNVRSFNLALYQAPIAPVAEDWSGFPNIVRIVDRGDPLSQTSDFGTMELYGASVVSSDPFALAEALREMVV